MAIAITLRVTPEQLKTQKNTVQADLDNIRGDITQITNEITGMSNYWRGEAATKQKASYEDHLEKIKGMLDRLQTYPDRIMKMAGMYEEAEETNKLVADRLETDIKMV